MSELQMTVTVAGIEKKTPNPNAPYTLNTAEGVRFKVFDRDGIVTRLLGMIGQQLAITYREETSTYTARNGPKAGQEVTSTDRIVVTALPAGSAPAVQASPQAASPAPVAAQAQPAAPVTMSVGVNWDAKDYSIWRQTAMKIAGHVVSDENHNLTLADYVSVADDLVHYFETGRLPDKLTDGQHRAIEALCGRLDTLEPTGAPWRDRVKRQLRKQYGREVPSMNDVRAQEAAWLIDVLQARVNTHDNPPPPPAPAPPVDPIGAAVGEAFPGAEEARPPFASDDDIPF